MTRLANFAERWKAALARTRSSALGQLVDRVRGVAVFDQERKDDLTELLLAADVGVHTAEALIEQLVKELRPGADPVVLLEQVIERALGPTEPLKFALGGATVWLLVGVNGSGKTTTAGKLAFRETSAGKRVLLAACDTFRAAAADQLAIWADRTGADFVRGQPGADPAAVVYDAMAAAKARRVDVVVVDTAGRLQTKEPLMAELAKMFRVVGREIPDGPHEALLVLDATFGQNALSQAKRFREVTPLTGLVLAKMDGTAKGGFVLSVRHETPLPVKLVGAGENTTDLLEFDPALFAHALVGGDR